jgi:hypothetical protein
MQFFPSLARCGDLDLECQKLVELISAVQTSKDTLDRSRAFAEACGKGIRFFFFWLPFCAVVDSSTHRGGYVTGRARLRIKRIAYAIHQRGEYSIP